MILGELESFNKPLGDQPFTNIACHEVRNYSDISVHCSSLKMDLDLTNASVSQQLDQICPPTIMDDMTLTSHTLVVQPANKATFTVEEGGNTIDDVTDVFDEESTMTVGGGDEDFDIPELPYDSLSDSKTTPITVRKAHTADVSLCQTFTKHGDETPIKDDPETSGYRTLSVNTVDHQDMSSSESADEIFFSCINKEPMNDIVFTIETEANLLARILDEEKNNVRSRSASIISTDEQSRCSSIGILRERDVIRMQLDSDLIINKPIQSKKSNIEILGKEEFGSFELNPKRKLVIQESRQLNSEKNSASDCLNTIPKLIRQNTFITNSSTDKLCTKEPKQLLGRHTNTMIPIT